MGMKWASSHRWAEGSRVPARTRLLLPPLSLQEPVLSKAKEEESGVRAASPPPALGEESGVRAASPLPALGEGSGVRAS